MVDSACRGFVCITEAYRLINHSSYYGAGKPSPKREQSFLNKLEKMITPFILEQNLPVLSTTLLTNQLICKVCKFWWFRLRFRQRLWLVPHSVFIVLHTAKYYKNIIKPDTVLVKVCVYYYNIAYIILVHSLSR